MKKTKIQWITIFFTLVTVMGYYIPVEAKKTPNFWIRNIKGERFDTRRYNGSYVISFFYVNCIPCIKEIPELHAMMSKEFPKSKLLFIDPVEEDSKGDIRDFAKKLDISYKFFYRDSFGSVSKKFFKGKFAFPTIVGILNKKMIFRHSGIDEEIKKDIRNKLLN